jgi:hypothetical protein
MKETYPSTNTEPYEIGPDEKLNFTPEEIEEALAQLKKPKMLHVEVTPKAFHAAQANPGDLRLTLKDANGNTIIERPHRLSDAEARARNEEYLRRRQQPPTETFFGSADPIDQHWIKQRDRHSGEVRYVPDNGGRNEYVVSDYDVFAVLRRDW